MGSKTRRIPDDIARLLVGRSVYAGDQPETPMAGCGLRARHPLSLAGDAGPLAMTVEKVEGRSVEGVISIASHHVIRASDIRELGVRRQTEEVADSLGRNHIAQAPPDQEGRRRQRARGPA
jgi:hypothetical protein